MNSIIETNVIELPRPKFQYITKEEDARRALSKIDRHSVISMDTETTGLDTITAKWSLLQIGTEEGVFVFDVRYDTDHSSVHPTLFNDLFTDGNKEKLLQNAAYDTKIIKNNTGVYLNNVYDTMLSEQLMHLGLGWVKSDLATLVNKYLGITLPKEPRGTFENYNQTFSDYQLVYAANDVVVLPMIKDLQFDRLKNEGLLTALDVESRFLVPLCEMELNGITIDSDRWRKIMSEVDEERLILKSQIEDSLRNLSPQQTLFGVTLVNIDSNAQLKKALESMGLELENLDSKALSKYSGLPVIDALLNYRKTNKLISTYAEPLLAKIHPVTGRLHTAFKQMVSTGRMSSSNPNLQNIPRKQKFRSCFIAKEGYSLITADMSGAELRILGNLSNDPIFIESYATGQDLHTRTASEVFGVPYDKVAKDMRNAAKAINFGLCYGMSAAGLSARLNITKKDAEKMIGKYFDRYKGVKKYLDKAAKDAVVNRFSTTIAGRRRYYSMPPYDHPDRKKLQASIERQGMNAAIQGANADTIKESLILLVDRLKGYDARAVLTVHDEVIIEAADEQKYEVASIVSAALVDGFGKYFSTIPMETEALIGKSWLKGLCESCHCNEMAFVEGGKYGTKLVCSKCGADQE